MSDPKRNVRPNLWKNMRLLIPDWKPESLRQIKILLGSMRKKG